MPRLSSQVAAGHDADETNHDYLAGGDQADPCRVSLPSQHQTVDEIHRELLKRLAPLGVKISRREILYLFEAYCTLVRASSQGRDDQEWLAQVHKNGGIIVSIDGIQPDKGNETIYLVRDALSGRVLVAENVTSSETTVMKALLAPVAALGIAVLGTITDAQESELEAVKQLWPQAPHQVCQFHVLRDAQVPKAQAEQLSVLDEYALGTLTALNRDGITPFDCAAVQAASDLDELADSLQRLEKKGQM